MDWTLLGYIGFILTSVIGAAWSLAWWFARQFTIVRNIIYETKDAILSKLEYHEKHDDLRFAEVRKDIWEIRLRNAVLDDRVAQKLNIKLIKQPKEENDDTSDH